MDIKVINDACSEKGFKLTLTADQLDGEFHKFDDGSTKIWAKPTKIYLKDGSQYVSVILGDYCDKARRAKVALRFTPTGEIIVGEPPRATKSEINKLEKAQKAAVIEGWLDEKSRVENLWSEWTKDKLDEPSGYLKKKNLPQHPSSIVIKNFDDNQRLLVIPMYDEQCELWNFQTIFVNGAKRMRGGARSEGLIHCLEGHPGVLLITEGYATALAAHYGSGLRETWCAFSLSQLESAVKIALKSKKPSDIIICADWDGETYKKIGDNPGMREARNLALKYGVKVAWPAVSDSKKSSNIDFADMWNESDVARELIAYCIENAESYEYLRPLDFGSAPGKVKRAKPGTQGSVTPEVAQTSFLPDNNTMNTIDPITDVGSLHRDLTPAASPAAQLDVSSRNTAGDADFLLPPTKDPINYNMLDISIFPDRGAKGGVMTTMQNFKVMCDFLGVTLRYNIITKEQEWFIPGETASVDNYFNVLYARFYDLFKRVGMDTGALDHWLNYLCEQTQFNPVASWLASREWDGISRLESFYSTVRCVDEAQDQRLVEMKKVLIRKWMLGALEGALNPSGNPAAGMLVFQGPQYIGKTKWLMSLVPKEFGITTDGKTLNPADKDSVKQTVRYWLVELGELDATFKKAEISALKAFITRERDMFRPAFAKKECNFVRRTVFFGSVNDQNFLADKTGNRRFWTLPVESCTWKHGLDMQQIWAELAVMRHKGGELAEFWLNEDEMIWLNESNTAFEMVDPIEEKLTAMFDWSQHGRDATATDLWTEVFGTHPTRGDLNAMSALVQKLGKKKMRKSHGRKLLWCGKALTRN